MTDTLVTRMRCGVGGEIKGIDQLAKRSRRSAKPVAVDDLRRILSIALCAHVPGATVEPGVALQGVGS